MTRQQPQPRRDIFTEFPAGDRAGLIVRFPDRTDSLGYSFADAAERLATTFRAQAPDDAMLLPFLYLYRHAIELDLKSAIRVATRLRRNNGESDPSLATKAVAERLQKKHGHRLMALLDELDGHLTALNLSTTPKDVRKLFDRISATDPTGESFRYGSGLANEQDQIDFPALAKALKYAYTMSSASLDMMDAYEAFQSDMLEEQRAIEAEIAADMRAEFEDWY
ncbi:hypothetical protein [Desertihabitans aurantiacus]|uniref:hypothetical protein n=1 Tax=Desertihabitans aurantiacus TaxID=2282477 RepID=UPI001300B829|nr:hypothetical protein [Desertihabitans aurantiacus]